jgi:hypothetical protein
LAQFKAALGLTPEQPSPPVPQQFESTPLDLTSERLFAIALTRNPRLKAMEAEVRRAEASIRLAYKARVPDFSVGVEGDAKASPVFVTPQLSVTLPIWRDKIAAQIAEAQAGKRASEARLSAEQIALAVEFAEKTFLYRESSLTYCLGITGAPGSGKSTLTDRLIASGHAYYDWMSREELEDLRKEQLAKGLKPKYDGRWRPERSKGLKKPEGVKPVVRSRPGLIRTEERRRECGRRPLPPPGRGIGALLARHRPRGDGRPRVPVPA